MYRGYMTFRRVLFAALAALCAVLAASPAAAAPIRRHAVPISAITLTPEGAGTLIQITYRGATRPHTRILRSYEAIDALAVADVDNDGDLDILAARQGGGLVLWRNAGRGRFIVAVPPYRRRLTRGEAAMRGVLETGEPMQSGDERCSAALPRAPAAAADPVETPHAARASSLVLSDFSACSKGRAPPFSYA
jgi:hypothetical protein